MLVEFETSKLNLKSFITSTEYPCEIDFEMNLHTFKNAFLLDFVPFFPGAKSRKLYLRV